VAAIVDTSVLYALTDRAEPSHAACVAAIRDELEAIIVPQVALPEACYLIGSRLGATVEATFVGGLASSDWALEPLSSGDLARVVSLLQTYAQADIGFVDAAVVAIAERLAVRRIFTLDRRDFGLVRPAHVAAFELLP